MLSRHLVLHQSAYDRFAQERVEDGGRVLVGAAEAVGPSVRAPEAENRRLQPTEAARGRQPAAFAGQVQQR